MHNPDIYPTLQSFVRRCILIISLVLNLNLIQLAVSNDDLFPIDFFGNDDIGGSSNDFPNYNLGWSNIADQLTDNDVTMNTDENNFFDNNLLLADNLSGGLDDAQSCRSPQQPVTNKKLKVRQFCSNSDAPAPSLPSLFSLPSFGPFPSVRDATTTEAQEFWCYNDPNTYAVFPVCSVDLHPELDYYVSLEATLRQFLSPF